MRASRDAKLRRAYAFFVDAENTGQVFSLDDVAATCGWKWKSVRTYRSKKWYPFVKETTGGFCAEGLIRIGESAFLRLSTQKVLLDGDILRPRFTPSIDALLDKSRESALLAVQIYNNPLVSFRAPGYVVHMVIAFTALFHAIFEYKGVDYSFKMPDGRYDMVDGEPKAWDASACAKAYYAGRTVPEGENLALFIQLRNKIEHRYLPALDMILSGKSQALLMNYEALLVKEFGAFFALGSNLALALQFSAYTDDQRTAFRRVQSQEFEWIRKFVQEFDDAQPDEIAQSPKYSFRVFLLPKIGNHAKSSDLAIEWMLYDPDKPDEMESYSKTVGMIRERHVPVANQGQLRASEVCQHVASKTGKKFGLFQHTCAWKLYGARPKQKGGPGGKSEFCQYSVPFKDYVYTEKWVDFLCGKVNDTDEYEKILKHREPTQNERTKSSK